MNYTISKKVNEFIYMELEILLAINYPGPEIGRDKFPLQIMNLVIDIKLFLLTFFLRKTNTINLL